MYVQLYFIFIYLRRLFFIALFAHCSVFAQTITTIAGNGTIGRGGDGGPASAAQVFYPFGIAIDKSGNLYIADDYNYSVRKIAANGKISLLAGGPQTGYGGDNDEATAAQFAEITGVAVDKGGNVFIADKGNSRVRKINTKGVVTTIAGNGSDAFSGDGGKAVSACLGTGPSGITVDNSGNILFTDNASVRKISPAGIITRVSGGEEPGFSGDGGPASAAAMRKPKGLALDTAGNMYIADYDDNRVRKISKAGIISTFAGNGYSSEPGFGAFYGDGGPATDAELSGPTAVVADPAGNVYISDCNNHCVRRVDANGIMTTIAGTAVNGYSGDDGPATAARFLSTAGLAIDAAGNLYICDPVNNRIRKVSHVAVPVPPVAPHK